MRGSSLIIAGLIIFCPSGGVSAQTLCGDANQVCAGRIDTNCLAGGRVGAGPVGLADVVARGDCATQFAGYRDCLAEVARDCANHSGSAGAVTPTSCSSEDARQLYASVADSEDTGALTLLVQRCPNSPQADFARLKLQRLQAGVTSTPADALRPPGQSLDGSLFPTEADYRAAQAGLQRLRLYTSSIDGEWGPASQRAMQSFKQQAGITPVDGELTQAALLVLQQSLAPASTETELFSISEKPIRTEQVSTNLGVARAHGETFRDCSSCPEMVALRGGTYLMGSPNDQGWLDEHPQHTVTIAPFAIGKYEVTFSQWDACFSDGGCSHRPNDNSWGRGSQPVLRISWNDAQEYVAWLSKVTGQYYRLLTEAEWEYAVRAGGSDKYSFGNNSRRLGSYAWFSDNSDGQPRPVGLKQSNPWGLYDMHGNVWEWVQDCYHGDYLLAPADGSAWMHEGNGDCSTAVLRGGSWNTVTEKLTSSSRRRFIRVIRYLNVGLRVAKSLAK